MLRVILSVVLVFALAGAAAASVAHGWGGGAGHVHGHADVDDRPEVAGAFAECCVASAGHASGQCLGDLAVMLPVAPAQLDVARVAFPPDAARDPGTARPSVPTGPPRA